MYKEDPKQICVKYYLLHYFLLVLGLCIILFMYLLGFNTFYFYCLRCFKEHFKLHIEIVLNSFF